MPQNRWKYPDGSVTIKLYEPFPAGESLLLKLEDKTMDYNKAALEMHETHKGKVGIVSKVEVATRDDLSTAYTPGVAEPCRKIKENPEDVYKYTFKGNMVAVVSNGTAVLGLGDIGGDYARKVHALGAHVIGVRRTNQNKPDYLDEQHTMDDLDMLLGRADIVAMVLPGGSATNHIMDERRLRLMKKGAYLINVGRGNAIDPDGLYKVLKDGHLGGCGLDVTEPEPLPADSPLWELENLVITPHVAGNFFLPETFERIIRIAGENLAAWANGTPYRNVVDFTTGYRKQ